MKNFIKIAFICLFMVCYSFVSQAQYEDTVYADSSQVSYAKTIGGTIYGSIQLVDTTPVLDMGIGGGAFFDYRFNEKFSIMVEAFAITQDGSGRSSGEGSIEFMALPAITLKLYVLGNKKVIDPYIGMGTGFYLLTEGSNNNSTKGLGIGAQIEVGIDYSPAENLVFTAGGTYRSVGLINSLSGTANASTYMPYTLFGRIGYRF